MPMVNGLPPSGLAEAYGRVAPAPSTDAGNVAGNENGATRTAPAGAGPAAVVQISEAARATPRAAGQPAIDAPGLNNGTMAAEGGDAGRLRSLLSERYDAQNARLNEPAS